MIKVKTATCKWCHRPIHATGVRQLYPTAVLRNKQWVGQCSHCHDEFSLGDNVILCNGEEK